MTQSQKILEVLADGELHCLTKELFMKDDRARISGLRKKGYEFYSPRCDGRCGIQHGSAVVMRKIVKTPLNSGFLDKKSGYSTPPSQITDFKGNFAKIGGSSLHPVFQKALFPYSPEYNH